MYIIHMYRVVVLNMECVSIVECTKHKIPGLSLKTSLEMLRSRSFTGEQNLLGRWVALISSKTVKVGF